jgi:hypothetical protein
MLNLSDSGRSSSRTEWNTIDYAINGHEIIRYGPACFQPVPYAGTGKPEWEALGDSRLDFYNRPEMINPVPPVAAPGRRTGALKFSLNNGIMILTVKLLR